MENPLELIKVVRNIWIHQLLKLKKEDTKT